MQIKLLSKKSKVPTYATDDSAAFDLYAAEDAVVPAHGQVLVDTGIAVAIPRGKCGQIWPRSGMDVGAQVTRGAGLIDADYRGPVKVLLINRSFLEYPVSAGDRIAQMVITTAFRESFDVVDELPATERGAGGFGHTGR